MRLGASTFYWIRVTNNGPAPVTGAVLTDQLFADGLALGTTACSSNGSTGTNLCTTTNKPTATQLTAGYTLPTIGVGLVFARLTWTKGAILNVAPKQLDPRLTARRYHQGKLFSLFPPTMFAVQGGSGSAGSGPAGGVGLNWAEYNLLREGLPCGGPSCVLEVSLDAR